MMFFPRRSLRTQLFCMFLVCAAGLLLISGYTLFYMSKLDRSARKIYAFQAEGISIAKECQVLLLTMFREEHDARVAENSQAAEARKQAWEKAGTELEQNLDRLDKLTQQEENQQRLKEIRQAFGTYKAAGAASWRRSGNVTPGEPNTSPAASSDSRAALDAAMAKLSVNIKNKEESARRFSTTSEADFHGTLTNTLIIATAVIGCCALVCWMIASSITGTVRQATVLANNLANGNLSFRMITRGEGELGELASHLNAMGDILHKLLGMITTQADNSSRGFLRKTLDTTDLKGYYLNLTEKINEWSSNMLMVIDTVPSPVMIRDSERRMRFLNAAAALGMVDVNQIEGQLCSSHFKTEDCENGNCACDKAVKTGKVEHSETIARPKPGLQLDIEYQALPFGQDGIMEFVVDRTDIVKIQNKIMDAATKAKKIAEQVSSASEELSAQVEQSSRGTEVQSSRVAETATAMEEMNATVLEVAKNASQASDSSSEARDKALEGAQIVAQVVAGIGSVQAISATMRDDMGVLGRQAEGIGAIMNVISDIADQTNLLALNAAIEAARAGDAGRGFAVVADEVRKLAEKTMSATKEVGEAISGIQQGTRKNLENVEHVVTSIEQATRLTNKSGEALQEIVRLVEVSTDQVRSIAAASEQQSAASEEINRSIEDINRISSETADAMNQSAQAVGELVTQASNLRQLIDKMVNAG